MKRVVKVGGSVITNKNSSEKPEVNLKVLDHLPDAVAYVFGVGAFGHKRAMKLGLTEEFVEVDVQDFESELEAYYDLVRSNFEADKPVYFGRIVEEDGKWRIVSGDEIVVKLAIENDSDEILYLTETGGVEMQDGSLLTEFDALDVLEVISGMKNTDYVDATGGMLGKLKKIKDLGFRGRVKFSKL